MERRSPSSDEVAQAISSISSRFQQMMLEKHAQRTPTIDRTHDSIRSDDERARRTISSVEHSKLFALSKHPLLYEDSGLLDEALGVMDLELLYRNADAAAERDDSLGYQDHLIKALLKWFKEDFFQWVNAPSCSTCGSETSSIGSSVPNSIESQLGAGRTELYRCTANGTHIERFPRYDNPRTLLTWRKGRCGEFANCFTMLCIALGSRARWVFNYEDHVWTEVYSTHLNRWVHCDSCENAWDAPQMYAVGWAKKMSHCIAFSITGAQDVSRRYIRELSHKLPMKVSPEVLSAALKEINHTARRASSAEEKEQYEVEDAQEELELEAYSQKPLPTKTQEAEPRESGSTEWKRGRGESGRST